MLQWLFVESSQSVTRNIAGIGLSEVQLNGQRGISADTALRLARYFGTSPDLWLNLQKTWELRHAEITNGQLIENSIEPHTASV